MSDVHDHAEGGRQASMAAFEAIKQVNPYGEEYWSARDLMAALGYDSWRRFADAIDRAKFLCGVANQEQALHFAPVAHSVEIGKGGKRDITEYHLTRYGVHLIVVSADLAKPEVAQALAYITFTTLPAITHPLIHVYAQRIRTRDQITYTKEQQTMGEIVRAFRHLLPQQQYRVPPYVIDLYFPTERIAVECDEHGHRKYDRERERDRQQWLETQLDCTFVRFNPDSPSFHLGDVIHQIMMLTHRPTSLMPAFSMDTSRPRVNETSSEHGADEFRSEFADRPGP